VHCTHMKQTCSHRDFTSDSFDTANICARRSLTNRLLDKLLSCSDLKMKKRIVILILTVVLHVKGMRTKTHAAS